MDGVFMFVMIGIGLAAGVQLLLVALVGSVIFNAMMLTLAHTKYAGQPRRLAGWTLVDAIPAEAMVKPKRSVAFRVDTVDQTQVEARLEPILALFAKEWRKATPEPLPDGRLRLEYDVTLKKHATPDELVSAIQSLDVPEIGEVDLLGKN
jgi:hypothetical protein